MASKTRGGYLDPSDKNYDKYPDHRRPTPSSVSKKIRGRIDLPGRGLTKKGFADLKKGIVDPSTEAMKELTAMIAMSMNADPVGNGLRFTDPQMAARAQASQLMNGLPGPGGTPQSSAVTQAILQKIMGTGGPQGLPPIQGGPGDLQDIDSDGQ